jgi:mRNA-degrading endonuclease RelE of RelBE toxin-antitoxin system
MSSYEVIIRPAARRDLQKLSDQIHDRIIKAL